MIDALLEAARLKALPRAGWVRVGVAAPESVAAHAWGVSWLVVVLLPDGLDRGRALTYAALHDLPEVRTGDLTPADRVPPDVKAAREEHAMAALASALPATVLAAWRAYEQQADPEARFVRQLDRLDLAVQAVAYSEAGAAGMDEFLASAEAFIDDPALVPIVRALRARFDAAAARDRT